MSTQVTEAQARQLAANQINEWMGATRGSKIHKRILEIYNTFPPIANDPSAYKMTVNDAWCACTVSSAMILLGYTDFTDYDISCNSWISKAQKRGIWVENEAAYMPKIGDFQLYSWSDTWDYSTKDLIDAANHIGMVTAIDGNTYYVTEGNMGSSSKVGLRMMHKNGKYSRGFITPDYAAIANAINSGKIPYPQIEADGGYNNGSLTPDQVKEMQKYYGLSPDGYWGPNSQRVTGMTADEAWAAYTGAGSSQNFPPYTVGATNEQTCYNFMTEVMKFNKAAVCGVLANIKAESNFNPNALGDSGTSYGICQWHNTRWTNLKSYCKRVGKDSTKLDGQLWFLKYELESKYATMVKKLKGVTNNAIGAYNAGAEWCKTFEKPSNVLIRSAERGNSAKNVFWPKYSGSSNTGSIASKNPYPTPTTTLRQGSKGDSVRWLQWMLYQLKFAPADQNINKFIDGSFGPTTLKYLKNFQSTYGLVADGSCGPLTRSKLLSL